VATQQPLSKGGTAAASVAAPEIPSSHRTRRDGWHAFNGFLNPKAAGSGQSLVLPLDINRFPYAFRRQELAIDRILVVLLPATDATWTNDHQLALTLLSPAEADTPAELLKVEGKGVPMASFAYGNAPRAPGTFTLTASREGIEALAEPFRIGTQLNAKAINDVLIVVHYSVKPTSA
jgi:hypothetical protein